MPNLALLEVLVAVGVEGDDLLVDHLPNRKGQLLGLEIEFLLLEGLRGEVDEAAGLLVPTGGWLDLHLL